MYSVNNDIRDSHHPPILSNTEQKFHGHEKLLHFHPTSIGIFAAAPKANTVIMCTVSWIPINTSIHTLLTKALKSPAPAAMIVCLSVFQ